MKKRLCSLLLVLTMLSTLLVAPASALEADGSTSVGNETYVYLGVKDYGTVEADSKPDFVHRFYTNGKEVQYTIASSDNKYAVQNKLQEGYVYDLTIEGGVVTDAAAATADAEGTIASIDDSTVTVNGAAVKYSAIYEISNNAAGATAVTKVTISATSPARPPRSTTVSFTSPLLPSPTPRPSAARQASAPSRTTSRPLSNPSALRCTSTARAGIGRTIFPPTSP